MPDGSAFTTLTDDQSIVIYHADLNSTETILDGATLTSVSLFQIHFLITSLLDWPLFLWLIMRYHQTTHTFGLWSILLRYELGAVLN